MKLSILMPVYNEEVRLADALAQALDVKYTTDIELVVVDDGSNDRTAEILRSVDDPRLRPIFHKRNQGKGAAIKTAVENATGDFMVILDADLEYDPNDIPRLLQPVLDGHAQRMLGNLLNVKVGVHRLSRLRSRTRSIVTLIRFRQLGCYLLGNFIDQTIVLYNAIIQLLCQIALFSGSRRNRAAF